LLSPQFEVIIMVLVGFCALVLTFVAFAVWRMKRRQLLKRIRAEMMMGEGRGGDDPSSAAAAAAESGDNHHHRFDRARSLLLSDRVAHRVAPITVSTATSPFEDSMFPSKRRRFIVVDSTSIVMLPFHREQTFLCVNFENSESGLLLEHAS
jgi:hypothetical protein